MCLSIQLYIDGEYVGGSEVVEELNECGELASMLKGFEVNKYHSRITSSVAVFHREGRPRLCVCCVKAKAL